MFAVVLAAATTANEHLSRHCRARFHFANRFSRLIGAAGDFTTEPPTIHAARLVSHCCELLCCLPALVAELPEERSQ
jgi:hypothetical protein